MKNLADLNALRERMEKEMGLRDGDGNSIRVLVGMATCGIAAGARGVFSAIMDELSKNDIKNVKVKQTGCIGVCRLEPIIEVYMPGKEKVTYVRMTPEKAQTIVNEHLMNSRVVTEYTIGAADTN